MTRYNSLNHTIAQAVAASFTSINVPPIDHRAVRERAVHSNLHLAHSRPRRLVLVALLVIICGVLAVPQVSANVAMAANTFWTRIIYVTVGAQGSKEEVPRTITLDGAAESSAFAFVTPRGLPQGAKPISVLQAPSNFGGAITVTYRLLNGKTFTITQRHSPALLTITRCFPTAANNSPEVSRKIARDPEIKSARSAHKRFVLNVVFSNPCPISWRVQETELTIDNMSNALSDAQLRSIITGTSR